ncbi:MAG: c-type cytochrome [Ghiorsea sp.]
MMKFISALSCVVALSLPLSVNAADVGAGKKIYTQICSYCHKANYDDKFGPGLAGIIERRDAKWLDAFLQNPQKMIESDEYAQDLKENNVYNLTMPKLPDMQDAEKRANVIAYLETLSD